MTQRRQNLQIFSTLFGSILAGGSTMVLFEPVYLPLLVAGAVVLAPLLALLGVWSFAELLSLDP
ncbi:hypothetical protein [Anthocerotibacter panamensis]|uniref:hypothetical protein n=1 Tax=Anthocerotibacter panamensis TaxID=2857077 RepID=UPI001C406D23|nr:hypothetical protein [Anthocerotibacter panamensis]